MEIDARKVDAHVGGRVRERREALGISQGSIARQLGLTFSQVQKYEKGANRIGAGRLFMLSQALGVPIQYFFDGLVAEPPVLISDNPDPSVATAASSPNSARPTAPSRTTRPAGRCST